MSPNTKPHPFRTPELNHRRRLHEEHHSTATEALLSTIADKAENIHVRLAAAEGFVKWKGAVPAATATRVHGIVASELQVSVCAPFTTPSPAVTRVPPSHSKTGRPPSHMRHSVCHGDLQRL